MARIEVIRGGRVVHVQHLGAQPVGVGRAPTNALAFDDARVSGHHAIIARDADDLVLTDLRSTNGTTVDGEAVTGRVVLRDGARVVLGGRVVLRIRRTAVDEGPRWSPVLVDRSTGIKHRIQSDRVRIGSAPECDVHVEGAPDELATLLLYMTGPIWVEAEEPFEVRPGEPFELGGRTWIVPEVTDGNTRTEELKLSEYPYHLEVSLDGGPGPRATVRHLQTGAVHEVGSANRAVLLFLLARQLDADRTDGVDPERAGWLPDDALRSGIWGILQRTMNPNNLQVLIRRVRLSLQDDGFDGWCIEKRSGHTRVRVDRVTMT